MNLLDLIGLGLAVLGLIVFLILILSSKFKQYKGIKEYKRIREKYTVNKRENAAEEIEAFDNADLIEDYGKPTSMITVNEIIGLLIVIIVVVAAAIPVVVEIVGDEGVNITGIPGGFGFTMKLIPIFLGLAAMVAVAKMMYTNS